MEPVLVGPRLRLRLMRAADAPALSRAVSDGELWRTPHTIVPSPDAVESYIQTALGRHNAGIELPFVTKIRETGQVVGSTRFRDADLPNRRIEISHIWVSGSFQRTLVNTEANYLMLKFAFEELECVRVQFRTDECNLASRASLLRIGVKEEGVMRNERVMPDGRKRNAVLYSVVDEEWPSVKVALERRLGINPA